MGWSYSQAAGRIMDAWTQACIKSTGSQNCWEQENKKRYFWETSRTEWPDGSITGTIFRFVGGEHVRRSGTFRINGDGSIERAPAFLKAALPDLFAEAYG